MTEATTDKKSQYQKRKEVEGIVKSLDRGQKGQLLEMLLEDWSETLPKRGKEYGVGSGDKYQRRLGWLQEHWGNQFETKGSTALRKMPLSGVLELLTLFCLSAADSKDADVAFGSLEDGSELGEKVASSLAAMKDASGPQVVISQAAYNELQKIRREYEELGGAGPESSTKILEKIFDQLQSMPSMKSEKETKAYETKKKKVAKDAMPAGFSS
jgi:hypothetical protein